MGMTYSDKCVLETPVVMSWDLADDAFVRVRVHKVRLGVAVHCELSLRANELGCVFLAMRHHA